MQGSYFDLLFPSRGIENLRNLRGSAWENLVEGIQELDAVDPSRIAFVLMMVRLNGCTSCQSDSFRAMRGCILCSTTTIKRYKASDQSLIDLYDEAKRDVGKYMEEEK